MRVRSFGWPGVAAGVSVVAVAAFLVAGWWEVAVVVVAIVQAAIVVLLARWARGTARKRALERVRHENRDATRSLEATVTRSAESTRVAVAGLDDGIASATGALTSVEAQLASLDEKLATVGRAFTALDGKLTAVDGKLAALDGRLAVVDGRLVTLGGKHAAVDGTLRASGETLKKVEGRVAAVEGKFGYPLVSRLERQVTQVEGLFQLYLGALTGGEGHADVMPASGGWAMDAANLAAALHVIERQRPSVVVEFGGGTSTVWIGKLLRRLGAGRIVSLDHDADFAESTRTVVERFGLGDLVDIRVVDLVPAGLADHETAWYEVSVLDDLDAIDVILVDGPPEKTGPLARYPAVPLCFDRLSDGAVILVDDTLRPDEVTMINRWKADYPSLREEVPIPKSALRILRKGESKRAETMRQIGD